VKKRAPDPELEAVSAPRDDPFPYRDYVAARDALRRAAHGEPFYGLVTGPSGSGKSSLSKDLRAALERPRFQIVYLSSSRASVLGVVNSLAQTLRVSPKRSSLETAQVIAEALKGATTTRYLLWVDEADLVKAETLAEVRILAESDIDAPQLLSVVFSGLPDLRAVLDARGLFPLKRRITLRSHLAGLGRDELDGFLLHRHGTAGARRFPAALRDELFERAEGIPALVHKVVRYALERAGSGLATEAILREAFDAAGL